VVGLKVGFNTFMEGQTVGEELCLITEACLDGVAVGLREGGEIAFSRLIILVSGRETILTAEKDLRNFVSASIFSLIEIVKQKINTMTMNKRDTYTAILIGNDDVRKEDKTGSFVEPTLKTAAK